MQSKNTRDFSHEMNQIDRCYTNNSVINDKYSALNTYICYNIDEEKHMEVVKGRGYVYSIQYHLNFAEFV